MEKDKVYSKYLNISQQGPPWCNNCLPPHITSRDTWSPCSLISNHITRHLGPEKCQVSQSNCIVFFYLRKSVCPPTFRFPLKIHLISTETFASGVSPIKAHSLLFSYDKSFFIALIKCAFKKLRKISQYSLDSVELYPLHVRNQKKCYISYNHIYFLKEGKNSRCLKGKSKEQHLWKLPPWWF